MSMKARMSSTHSTWLPPAPTPHILHLHRYLVILLALLVLSTSPAAAAASATREKPQRCLVDWPVVNPRRDMFYDGKSLPITIETSNRPSHQLVSHIFKILVDEVLGYNAQVIHKHTYNSMDPAAILDRLSGCTNHSGCEVPESIVNLEVWSTAGFNMERWIDGGLVMDSGPLGPFGKFGWFMPSAEVQRAWTNESHILDHWRSLQAHRTVDRFAAFQELIQEGADYRESWEGEGGGGEGVEDCEDCPVPVYSPPWCKGPSQQHCATLLSSYQALDAGILASQISELKLLVQVAWVGGDLNDIIKQQTQKPTKAKPPLFFNWVPNVLTISNNFTRVNFPFCRTRGSTSNATWEGPGGGQWDTGAGAGAMDGTSCDFEVQQLSKLAWVRLESRAPYVHQLLQRLMFTQREYEEMLALYLSMSTGRGHDSYHQAACTWLRENTAKWEQWVPSNLPNEMIIYLAGMFPLTGKFVREPGTVLGARLALFFINKDPRILKNYKLDILVHDTECQADVVLAHFLNFLVNVTHPIVGIVGPSCSETAEPIAGVAKHFNRIIVSYSAEALHLSKRAMFPYFFRTLPHITQNGVVYIKMFQQLGWKQVALLAEDGQEFPEYHTYLQDLFQAEEVQVIFHRKMPRDAGTEDTHKVPFLHNDRAVYSKYLEEIRQKGAKIIILTSFEVSGRAVFCEAYKQQMTAARGYVWFLPGWYTNRWWDTDHINTKKISAHIDCTSKQMLETIQGHLVLSSAIYGNDDDQIVGNMTVARWKQLYTRWSQYQETRISSYASYVYDTVWVFALALDKLLTEDPSRIESIHTDQTRHRFMHFLNQTYFHGVTGPVQFKDRDRTGIIDITQQWGNATKHVGQYVPDQNGSDTFWVKPDIIAQQFNGQVPEDGSQKSCSVENFRELLGVECHTALVIVNIMAVSCFVVFIIVLFIIIKKRYDDKVQRTQQRMEELGLMENTSLLSLDQWEIAREHVVLNRKLGEGAFGTVYGGEVSIEDTWMAVAVKTLKVGSNTEEKLNFLYEAEKMKRFDHENIVKLLGVCTRGEPAYTIMEFMLHGDLKTFLLARRHLVGDNSREAEDVSTHSLTRMARDIATGLQYLSSQQYVHRDLACRNCLVHATKTVKIGDFGMTRSMFDSDYYRFNRQGMLPVRWMAPESLRDGIFTLKSDVWSFGVLLYEIMTFGSFPYQGLGNKQVLDYVNEGKIITLPANCSDELQRLLKSCWRYDYHQRPDIASLREELCARPCLIQPCLDVPRSAIDPPRDDDHLHDIRYKRTVSEHSHLRNMEAGAGGGGGIGAGMGGIGGIGSVRPLQTSPTALSITSDPLSHEEVLMASHDIMDWNSCSERTPPPMPDNASSGPPLPHLHSTSSLKDLVVKMAPNNHMRAPSYVVRGNGGGGGGGRVLGRPLSVGDSRSSGSGSSAGNYMLHNQNQTEKDRGGGGGAGNGGKNKTMRTIANPIDTIMANPDIIQFTAGPVGGGEMEANGYTAGAACLTNGTLFHNKKRGCGSDESRLESRLESRHESSQDPYRRVSIPLLDHRRPSQQDSEHATTTTNSLRPHELALRKESVA